MSRFCLVLTLLVVTACGEATRPTPEMDAIKAFLDAKSSRTDACLRALVLTTDAYKLIQSNMPLVAVVESLMKKYAPATLTNEERTRLTEIMAGQSAFAFRLKDLSEDSVSVAYLQTCRYQAGGGKVTLTEGGWPERIAAAGVCEKENPSGMNRKECLAKVFARK